MPTLETTPPEVMTLTGVNLLLYNSGVKRGHAEACAEQGAHFQRMAHQYRAVAEGPPPTDGSKVDTQTCIDMAVLFDSFAKQLSAAERAAAKEQVQHMDRAMQAMKAHKNAAGEYRIVHVSWKRRLADWVSSRLAQFAQ